MKLEYRPHYIEGLDRARSNGCSIIRDSNSFEHRKHYSVMAGCTYEVLDKKGDIHRFNNRNEMLTFVKEQ